MDGVTPTVVVGVDGSAWAAGAVRWAAAEAGRLGGELLVLHAYDRRWIVDPCLEVHGFAEVAEVRAAEVVADAELVAHTVAPTLRIRCETAAADPARVLLAAARRAALAVVGNRGCGGSSGLGSVAQAVAIGAPCPVVVVRGRVHLGAGPVVVGVDGSPDGTAALDAAFRQAAASGCPVQAVRAFRCPLPSFACIAPSLLWPEQSATVESKALTRLLEPFRRRYPAVPVEELVDRGDAADALVRASRHARLVVVGNRGSGQHTGPLPGSAALNLLHHADCPVMIVRPVRIDQLVGASSAARRPPVDG